MVWFLCACSDSVVPAEHDEARSKIIADVHNWAKVRSLPALLNDLNGSQPGDELFLAPRPATFSPVSKAYKRALLKVHPDKHMHDPLAHLAATERFKALNDAWIKYKKQMNRD